MAGNPTFLKAEPTLAWLGQFAPEDQPDAAELLGRMRLVIGACPAALRQRGLFQRR